MRQRRRRARVRRAPLMDQYCSRLGQLVDQARAEAALKAAKQNAEKAAEAALGASRAKSDFLAKMSHEIRTPMNGVLGMTALLLRSNLSDRQRKYVTTAHHSAETLLHIINDILDFSIIEAGKLTLDSVDFDIHGAIGDVIDLLAGSAQGKGLEIGYVVSRDVPRWVRGDPNRLRQIVFNLVGNSIKFTERGEIVVRVGVRAETEGSVVLSFEVSDTGIGIAPDAKERILQPFEQADGSITRRYGGTGLGLAIARQLIELMNGSLSIDSAVGHGSTFRFDVTTGKVEALIARSEDREPDLTGKRVLIIDDNATNREILHYYLDEWRLSAQAAADGPRGLDLLKTAVDARQAFDLVLLDMMMPDMSGLEVARAIRADESLTGTKIIVLTSMGRHMETDEIGDLEGISFLTKPVRQSELHDQMVLALFGESRAKTNVSHSGITADGVSDDTTAAPATGFSALIAEDNPVNQEVALEFLKAMGLRADVVASGLEVLDALEHRAYDIVLMDCHMPDMDGLEAAAILRERENRQKNRTRMPIIAVTANAFEGERERCLAAGMDDFLSKPFGQDKLFEVLKRWLPSDGAAKSLAMAGQPRRPAETGLGDGAARADDSLFDTKILDDIRRLQNSDVPNVLAKVIDIYLDTSPQLLQKLNAAVFETRSPEAVELAAHSLKSSSGNLGAVRLAALCRELEVLAQGGDLSGAERLYKEIETLYPLVCGRLKEERSPAENPGTADASVEGPCAAGKRDGDDGPARLVAS